MLTVILCINYTNLLTHLRWMKLFSPVVALLVSGQTPALCAAVGSHI